MRALVARGKMDFMLGQVTALEGEDGQLSRRAASRRNDKAISTIACDADAAVLRADHEARPGRQLGHRSSRTTDPGRHRDVRDQRAGHLRHRRHQHLSRQAEADPVRLPRGGADGAEAHRYVYPDKRLVFQYTTSSSSLQKKLGVN